MKRSINLFLTSIFFLILPHISLPAFDINSRGIWVGADVTTEHRFDPSLANALVHFFKEQNVTSLVDFGCGMADYVLSFQKNGFYAEGYDGNPYTPQLTKGLAGVKDLSSHFYVGKDFDWVINLEVGESLPPQYEKTFLENLVRHSKKGIVLSWAIIGQGGTGHVNEQNNNAVKQKLAVYGFFNDLEAENKLRTQASLSWFKNSLMIFRRL